MDSGNTSRSSQRWLRRVLRPSWLAGIVSVGFHGALFAAGPTFTGLNFDAAIEPELSEPRRQVPLVELSAAEQARLPDFSNSFYNFETFDDLAPLDPLFQEDYAPDNSLEDDFEKFEDDDLIGSSRPTYTPSIRLPFPTTTFESRRPLPTPAPVAGDRPTPPTPAPTESASREPTPTEGNPDSVIGSRGESTTAIAPGAGSAADLEITPRNPTREADTPRPPAIPISRTPNEGMTLEERVRAFAYDSTGTTAEAAEERLEAWLTETQTALEAETEAPIEIAMTDPVTLPYFVYGQQPCLPTVPHTGLIGALVSDEGELLDDLEILKSTGYLFIDRQAEQYVQSIDFQSVDRLTAYLFEVEVDYDAELCIDLGLRPDPETTDSQETGHNRDRESGVARDVVPPESAAPVTRE